LSKEAKSWGKLLLKIPFRKFRVRQDLRGNTDCSYQRCSWRNDHQFWAWLQKIL